MAEQKKRQKKTSQGIHGGGGKVTLTAIQKVLIAGPTVKHVECKKAYAGTFPAIPGTFDAEQSRKNKALGYWS